MQAKTGANRLGIDSCQALTLINAERGPVVIPWFGSDAVTLALEVEIGARRYVKQGSDIAASIWERVGQRWGFVA